MKLFVKSYKIIKYSFLLFVLFSTKTNSQTEKFLKKQEIKIDSTINIYKSSKKKLWLNFIPSINYDLKESSFSVGFNLNSLTNFYQQKQRNKIQLAQLENSLREKVKAESELIKLDIEEYNFKKEILKNKIDIFKIDHDIFKINKGKYKNGEIATQEFFKYKKEYLTKINNLKNEFYQIKLKAKKIEKKTEEKKYIKMLDSIKVKIKFYKNIN